MSRYRTALAIVLVALGVLAARGEGTDVRRLGLLSLDRSGPSAGRDAFVEALAAAGYVVGRNLAIEYRFADGDRARLPALARELVAQRVEVMVDKVLRGARAGDIPIEQPTMFDLALNLRTARELGVTPPATVLVRAHRVIE